LRTSHQCAEAALEYEAYLARNPEDANGHLGAGRTDRELGDGAGAVRHFDRALELDPENAQTHKERADIHLRQGENDLALAHLDHAARIDPENFKIRYGRALALSRLGRAEEAKAEQFVVDRLRADDMQIALLRRRLLENPKDVALQCRAARWFFDHDHAQEGVRWAEKALRDQPGDFEACRLLADHYQRCGKPGLANFYRVQISAQNDRIPPPPSPEPHVGSSH
jgi:Flp pilus assembly protein TadD